MSLSQINIFFFLYKT